MLEIGPATPSRGPRHPKGASRKPSTGIIGMAWHLEHGGKRMEPHYNHWLIARNQTTT